MNASVSTARGRGSRPGRVAGLVLLLPFALVLTAYVLYPSARILLNSLLVEGRLTLAYYREFFDLAHPANLDALWGSVYVSLLTVLFGGLVGVPLAYLFTHYDFPGRSLFAAVAVLPVVMPPLVGVLAFLFLFGESGILPRALQALFGLKSVSFALNGIPAIVVVHTYAFYVYFYLFAQAAFQAMDASVLEAARSLGAGRWLTWRRVVLPLLAPALTGASLLTFMASMQSFSAPFIFAHGTRILSLQIYNSKLNGEMALAQTQSVVLVAISLAFFFLHRLRRERTYFRGGKGVRIQPKPISRGWPRYVLGAVGMLWVGVLVAPHLTVVLISFVKNGTWTFQILPEVYTWENYTNLFHDPRLAEPILNSVKMAALATAGNVVFGVALAYLLLRKRVPGAKVVETLTMLPWAIPGTVLAISFIVAFSRPSLFSFGGVLVGTFWILPLAYFVRNLPLVFRSTYAALEQFEPELEQAARNLGASWWFAFRKVLLPLIAPGVMAGALLAFVFGLGEFVASILLYTYSNRPISVEIISQLRIFNLGSAAAYSVLLILLIAAVSLLSGRFLRTRTSGWVT